MHTRDIVTHSLISCRVVVVDSVNLLINFGNIYVVIGSLG